MKKILLLSCFFFGLLIFYNPPPVTAADNTATDLTVTDFNGDMPAILFTVQDFRHKEAQEVAFVFIGNSYAASTTDKYMIISKNRSPAVCERFTDVNNKVNEIMHTKTIFLQHESLLNNIHKEIKRPAFPV